MTPNPAGAGLVVSTTVKAVLIAIASLGLVPLSEDQIGAVVVAVAAVFDLVLYFGWIRPRLDDALTAHRRQDTE